MKEIQLLSDSARYKERLIDAKFKGEASAIPIISTHMEGDGELLA